MIHTLRRLLGLDPVVALKKTLGDMELPALSATTMATLQALRDPDAPMSRVGDLLSRDPGLSVGVLRMANRASNGLRRPCRDAVHAAQLVGRNELEVLVVAAAARQAIPDTPGMDHRRFWRDASMRASVARRVAEVSDPASSRQAFTAALLQDMAVPLLFAARTDYRPLVADGIGEELGAAERAAFGWDHAEVAGWICGMWQLPDGLSARIADHHEAHADVAMRVAPHALTDEPEEFIEVARVEAHIAPERAQELLATATLEAKELYAALG